MLDKIKQLLYLPLDMENPPLDCLEKLNDVDFLKIIRDDFRNCWQVPLMFHDTDHVKAKKSDLDLYKEPYAWTEIASEFPTLTQWCEDVLFPVTKKSRIMIITTLPGEANPPHIDCSPKKFNTLQHKFRCVLQGHVDDLVFMSDKDDVYLEADIDKPFIMSGRWPHYMLNTHTDTKFTLAFGAPWDSNLEDKNYMNLLDRSYKKYNEHYVGFEGINLPKNYEQYYETK